MGSANPGLTLVPECVAKGSRFTFGGLGVDPCSRDPAFGVRKRLPSAFVGAKLPCLWDKSQKRDFFDVSEAVVMSFCVAGVALRGIPTCFKTCPNSFCVAGAILLLHFQTMCCVFRGRRSTLDTSECHFAWQAQHFGRVVLRVFCESHCQRCAKW